MYSIVYWLDCASIDDLCYLLTYFSLVPNDFSGLCGMWKEKKMHRCVLHSRHKCASTDELPNNCLQENIQNTRLFRRWLGCLDLVPVVWRLLNNTLPPSLQRKQKLLERILYFFIHCNYFTRIKHESSVIALAKFQF